MSSLDRIKNDLDQLILLGDKLQNAIQIETFGAKTVFEKMTPKIKKDQFDKLVAETPSFNDNYERWYSQASAVIKLLIPDRIVDFRSMYEKPKNRKEIDHSNYVIQDYLQGLTVRWGGEIKTGPSSAIPQFRQQLAILRLLKTDLKPLFSM